MAQAVSIHTARWISQVSDQGWDLHVFDMLGSFPHPELRGITEYSLLQPRYIPLAEREAAYDLPFFLSRGWDPFPLSIVGFFVRRLFRRRQARLASVIQRLRPDLIHSFELQTQSYDLLPVIKAQGGKHGIPWIVNTWGSDIFYYRQFPEHVEKIRALLQECDYLIPDCRRDETLARGYGFRGVVPLILPGSGGYPLRSMRRDMAPGAVAERRTIMLKGYQGWAGRAVVALDALEACSDLLKSYEIVVHSASPGIEDRVRRLVAARQLNIRILPRSPHREILRHFGQSRVAIGVNVTDGVPNAMLEAMTMGALPIQSDTESTAEWIDHGENGLLVDPGKPGEIAAALRTALTDDDLVERAAARNLRQLQERLDISVVKPRVIEMYRSIAAAANRGTP